MWLENDESNQRADYHITANDQHEQSFAAHRLEVRGRVPQHQHKPDHRGGDKGTDAKMNGRRLSPRHVSLLLKERLRAGH